MSQYFGFLNHDCYQIISDSTVDYLYPPIDHNHQLYDYADTKIYLYHSHHDQTANIEEVPLKQESKHDTTYMDIIRIPPFPWLALDNASYSAVFIRPRSSIGMWHVLVTFTMAITILYTIYILVCSSPVTLVTIFYKVLLIL